MYRSKWKAHINTWNINWNVLTITDVFLDQKRVNVCEHMVNMVLSLIVMKMKSETVSCEQNVKWKSHYSYWKCLQVAYLINKSFLKLKCLVISSWMTTWKAKSRSMDNTIGKGRRNSSESITWCRLYHVFSYTYSLWIEKHICDH